MRNKSHKISITLTVCKLEYKRLSLLSPIVAISMDLNLNEEL